MSISELAKRIGTSAKLNLGEITVEVTIADVRSNFGRADYRVTPLRGSGLTWVSEARLTIHSDHKTN